MKLRDYQENIFKQITSATSNDLVQLDTGAGKTPIQAALAEFAEYCLLIAHRNILIAQISEKLAAFGLRHDTITTEHTRRRCMLMHRRHGRNYIERGHATRRVASIDSLLAHHRRGRLDINTELPWLIVIDEAHHVIPDNKWGKLREIFPNARIVGFTATPARMDGESLHVKNGGLFDRLVQAQELEDDSIRKLIERGYLSNFRVYAPREELEENSIAGDPVKWYKRLANNKRAVAMCPSIRNAEEFSNEFREAGISSACISSQKSSTDVARIIDAFVAGDIKVLCNVDMVGEGFDVPGIEVMIFLRETKSFIAFRQWIGRALRPHQDKECAIIIDHCGNVSEHGMPDEQVKWDLISPPKGLKYLRHGPCCKCFIFYPVKLRFCPECGAENELHTRVSIGNHYINISRIDTDLIEKAKREYAMQKYEERMNTEIFFPYFMDGGVFGKHIESLRKWFVATLESDGAKIRDINEFLLSNECKSNQFWTKYFVASDARSENTNKVRKAFKEWKNSR